MCRLSSFFVVVPFKQKGRNGKYLPIIYGWDGRGYVTFFSTTYQSLVAKRCHFNDKDEERGRKK